MSGLELRPIKQADAFAFVAAHHRHHDVPVGALWQHGAHDEDGRLCGVAVVGRPVARTIDDGLTVEVTRLCTTGELDTCSLLYTAARRVALDKGYRRGLTYILEAEFLKSKGASLRASGYRYLGQTTDTKGWDRKGRPRQSKWLGPKYRFGWGEWPFFDGAAAKSKPDIDADWNALKEALAA